MSHSFDLFFYTQTQTKKCRLIRKKVTHQFNIDITTQIVLKHFRRPCFYVLVSKGVRVFTSAYFEQVKKKIS